MRERRGAARNQPPTNRRACVATQRRLSASLPGGNTAVLCSLVHGLIYRHALELYAAAPASFHRVPRLPARRHVPAILLFRPRDFDTQPTPTAPAIVLASRNRGAYRYATNDNPGASDLLASLDRHFGQECAPSAKITCNDPIAAQGGGLIYGAARGLADPTFDFSGHAVIEGLQRCF